MGQVEVPPTALHRARGELGEYPVEREQGVGLRAEWHRAFGLVEDGLTGPRRQFFTGWIQIRDGVTNFSIAAERLKIRGGVGDFVLGSVYERQSLIFNERVDGSEEASEVRETCSPVVEYRFGRFSEVK